IQRNYDLTPVVQSGSNTICLLVQNPTAPAQVKAEVEVEDASGAFERFDSGKEWFALTGARKGWLDPSPRESNWLPCQVETGDIGVPPNAVGSGDVELVFPFPGLLGRAAAQTTMMVIVALVTALACGW